MRQRILALHASVGNAALARMLGAQGTLLARELSQDYVAELEEAQTAAPWDGTLQQDQIDAITDVVYAADYNHPQANLVLDMFTAVVEADGLLAAVISHAIKHAKRLDDADVKAALAELERLIKPPKAKGPDEDDDDAPPGDLPAPDDPVWALLMACQQANGKPDKATAGNAAKRLVEVKAELLEALEIIVAHPSGAPTVPIAIEQAERRIFDLVSVIALRATELGGSDPVAAYVFSNLVECGFVERLLYIRLLPRDQLKGETVLCHHSDISVPLLEALRRLSVGAKVVIPHVGHAVPIEGPRLERLQAQYMKQEYAKAFLAYVQGLKKT